MHGERRPWSLCLRIRSVGPRIGFNRWMPTLINQIHGSGSGISARKRLERLEAAKKVQSQQPEAPAPAPSPSTESVKQTEAEEIEKLANELMEQFSRKTNGEPTERPNCAELGLSVWPEEL